MIDYIFIGSTPPDEPCLQVGTPECTTMAQLAECRRYIRKLRSFFGPEPPNTFLKVKSQPHDFGTYYEVVCYFDTEDDESIEYAYRCEGEGPQRWEEEPPSPAPDNSLAQPSLDHDKDLSPSDCSPSDPMEFSESEDGYEARVRWAQGYDELNGAPEGPWDC